VERAPRKVMLTPRVATSPSARAAIVAEVEQMRESARRSRDPQAGTLRLGVFPTLGPVPAAARGADACARRFPQLELLLVEEKTDVMLRQLREGRLDAGVLALPLHDDQLHVEFLFEEPFVLAVPARARTDAQRAPCR
jgi:LysR family hydrogen peroxide-inducible transcriptional activator